MNQTMPGFAAAVRAIEASSGEYAYWWIAHQVADLAALLIAMGARIEGVGSDFAVARPFELSLSLDTGERVDTAGAQVPQRVSLAWQVGWPDAERGVEVDAAHPAALGVRRERALVDDALDHVQVCGGPARPRIGFMLVDGMEIPAVTLAVMPPQVFHQPVVHERDNGRNKTASEY